MTALVLAVLLVAEPESGGEKDVLGDPSAAVEWILSETPPTRDSHATTPWDGSLGDAAVRGLFGFYRTVLSSQDSQVCGFTPSCSRFSQLAIARLGFVRGLLVTADRLLRDHPLSPWFYDSDPASGLRRDDPDRYGVGVDR